MANISDSEFYMWRTLFAIAHADNIVTEEEVAFMSEILNDVNFTDEQVDILKDDILNAKNTTEMFDGVTNTKDRVKFFEFARDLVWIDGDFASEEQSVMIDLYKQHIEETTVDELVGKISLEFEEDKYPAENSGLRREKIGAVGMLAAFKKFFLGK